MKTLYEQWLEDEKVPFEPPMIGDWGGGGYSQYEVCTKALEIVRSRPMSSERDDHLLGNWLRDLGREPREYRWEAVARFGFAILDESTVNVLRPHGPFLEVGAGTGYWSHELHRQGIDSIATDPHPLKEINLDRHKKDIHIYPNLIYMNGYQAIDQHLHYPDPYRCTDPTRTLLMVWPSYAVSWPVKVLHYFLTYGGRKIVYVGEWGGCTADDDFHDLLEKEFTEVLNHRIPQWHGIHDQLWVYEKK